MKYFHIKRGINRLAETPGGHGVSFVTNRIFFFKDGYLKKDSVIPHKILLFFGGKCRLM